LGSDPETAAVFDEVYSNDKLTKDIFFSVRLVFSFMVLLIWMVMVK
jgi:hypothetical protein